MLFSSLLFLYLFLPVTLFFYYFGRKDLRNYILLAASLIFFAWGGVSYSLIILISISLNYFFGIKIESSSGTKKSYWWLFTGVACNLIGLTIFKYTDFLIENINTLGNLFNATAIPLSKIILPVGISFYTFHALSYLVDIYKGKTKAQRNIFDLALYICMFSQLIAGPIIRYSDVWQQLQLREHSIKKFSSGIERFLIGLGKKVLLSNIFATVADATFGIPSESLGSINAWLGIICYSLQIYYDFSGYSDMAIGLGRMFGFEFLENFDLPYIARSVKEFWRRWHISLSSFFRDYVYIPLGGNKVSVQRNYLNLIIVFFLTGFWHGASWTFILWGLFHGFFLISERLFLEKLLIKSGRVIANTYTIIVVMLGWVLFRADTLSYALLYWKKLFDFTPTDIYFLSEQWNIELLVAMIIGISGALGIFPFLKQKLSTLKFRQITIVTYTYEILSIFFFTGILLLCSLYLVAGTYNPFIYYRF
ncbi:MAG: MBOAT family O-acyltransferase [Sediminibacterium sp.]|nr:MBOAT family O-acyltransferase [Sediminibacterium sp.]